MFFYNFHQLLCLYNIRLRIIFKNLEKTAEKLFLHVAYNINHCIIFQESVLSLTWRSDWHVFIRRLSLSWRFWRRKGRCSPRCCWSSWTPRNSELRISRYSTDATISNEDVVGAHGHQETASWGFPGTVQTPPFLMKMLLELMDTKKQRAEDLQVQCRRHHF